MPDILTITLNPAFDVSSSVDKVVPGPKLRCEPPRHDPGGGGVNVSRAIQRLEGRSLAFVALGGGTGALLRALLDAEGIRVVQFHVAGNTRQSFAVLETSTMRQFRFQLPGPVWPEAQTAAMLADLGTHMLPGRVAVLSGSLPPGMPPETVSVINKMALESGARLIVDTSGPALKAAADNRGQPFAIMRMDGEEGEQVSGRRFTSPAALADYGLELVRAGAAERLVMSMGALGTVGVSADERFFCQPPKIETLSAVGAGDSMVAAIAMGFANGASFRDAVRHGVAAAGSAVLTPATELCSKAKTDEFLSQVVTSPV